MCKSYETRGVRRTSLSVCMCACVRVCVSLSSDSSETFEVLVIKLGTVGASDMLMHHVLIIVILTLILKVTQILIMKIRNVRSFQKQFKQSPLSLL